ncbi:MAG: hypothetical protein LBQ82_08380 [Treponema sp.]|jgi:hypothetical protein|nr:hypothetical protein [Treponema sp.]
MSIKEQHSFWGSLSPLGGLSGAGLLIMSSARLSWAVTTALGIFWVYGLTSFAFSFLLSETGRKFLPKLGRIHIFTCMASFFGSVYLLLFWILCPYAAYEVLVPLLLIPLFCSGSGTFERIVSLSDSHTADVFDLISDAVSQAAILAVLLIVFSIIREPLSYCSLSFPGTSQGMVVIMYFKAGSLFPMEIFAASAGALLLLGYFICLYQYSKSVFFPGEDEK